MTPSSTPPIRVPGVLTPALLLLCSPVLVPAAHAREGRRPGKAVRAGEAGQDAAALDALGKAAYRRKQYDDAIAAFEAAWEADPQPRFLFNLARSHEKRGDLARASHHFERYLRAEPGAEDRRKVKALAKMLRVKLKKAFGRVLVTSEPDGAFVRVRLEGGGETVEGATPFSEWLPFGHHELTVSKDGYEPFTRAMVVQPKASTEVAVELARSVAEPAPPPAPEEPGDGWGSDEESETVPPPPPPPAPPSPEAAGVGWVTWATLGAAAGLLGGGAALGLLARQEEEARDGLLADAQTRPNDVRYVDYEARDEAARSRALVANVLLGVGAAAAVAGGVLLFAGGDGAAAPWPVPGGGGLSVVWRGGP